MRDLKSNEGVDFAMFEMKLNLRCPSIHREHIINGCAHGNPPKWARQRAGLSKGASIRMDQDQGLMPLECRHELNAHGAWSLADDTR